jgi:hypothetical protein
VRRHGEWRGTAGPFGVADERELCGGASQAALRVAPRRWDRRGMGATCRPP